MEYSQVFKSCKKNFKKVDIINIKFSVKIRDMLKIEKKFIPSALALLVIKNNKNIQIIYQKLFCEEKHVDTYS